MPDATTAASTRIAQIQVGLTILIAVSTFLPFSVTRELDPGDAYERVLQPDLYPIWQLSIFGPLVLSLVALRFGSVGVRAFVSLAMLLPLYGVFTLAMIAGVWQTEPLFGFYLCVTCVLGAALMSLVQAILWFVLSTRSDPD